MTLIDSLCGKLQVCDVMSYLRQIKIEIINLCTQKRQIFNQEYCRLGHNSSYSTESLRDIDESEVCDLGDISEASEHYLVIRGRKCYVRRCVVLQLQVVNLVQLASAVSGLRICCVCVSCQSLRKISASLKRNLNYGWL